MLLYFLHFLLAFKLVLGASYTQSDSHTGIGFLKSFSYQAIPDPTHGRVNYVDAYTAANENLTYASGDHFVLRTDYWTVLDPNGPGRDSVRIQSNKQYTTSVMVFNIRHMPQGCGTWPAVWTVGEDWPNNGEIDVLEGVNDQGPNQATLHTSAGCTMPDWRYEKGNALLDDCNTLLNSNSGCGVKFVDTRSYGPIFNDHGGGWFASERSEAGISVWFWSRDAGTVPYEVEVGNETVDTDNWGEPSAYFPNTDCDIGAKFGPHNIVINLSLCGDWAGSAYGASGCPSTCEDYVDNNPWAFEDAYFDFQWLKIYT
ncbi:glycoside hydrolase family 16 protein [Lentinula edodes]|uniref:Glycoside hydrolase family 16 protein n=1 Tax=Lentinula edodes TaxID=5353 RepID=A0A1Q3DYG9_LENED|nr:glycoside hydrolase family 16 protein [Lentinula edodes]